VTTATGTGVRVEHLLPKTIESWLSMHDQRVHATKSAG
jgi:hypothetical protein